MQKNNTNAIMDKFKLPRLEKKKLKKQFWLYPEDEKGKRKMALPWKYGKDYEAMKQGVVKNFFDETPEEKEESRKEQQALDKEIYIPDEELKEYIDVIFANEFRTSSFYTLLEAKNHSKAKKAYFNFVNAYHKNSEDNSFGNICCLSVDRAKELLKSSKRKGKKKRRGYK